MGTFPNSSKFIKDISNTNSVCNTLAKKDGYSLTPSNRMDTITSLKKGKSPGKDSIYIEHFIYAHNKVAILLSMIINIMFIHGYISQAMMDTVHILILKYKKGNDGQG